MKEFSEDGIRVMEKRAKKIVEACLQEKSKNPIDIFCRIAQMDFGNIMC